MKRHAVILLFLVLPLILAQRGGRRSKELSDKTFEHDT